MLILVAKRRGGRPLGGLPCTTASTVAPMPDEHDGEQEEERAAAIT